MSRSVVPDGPIVVPETVVAEAPVKVTVPKFAKGTRLLPSSKSSTIHSAFSKQSAGIDANVWVTVLPVVTFSMTAVPDLVVEAVTVSLITLPAEMGMPLKSTAEAGNHSCQAIHKDGN